jgi:acetate kinase
MNAHDEKLLLILNAGSSTLKFAVFNSKPAPTPKK